MRILHTSDWHFGAYLEQHSRLDEQYAFIEELAGIAESKKIDMIIVAGDIYDTSNPPASAEKLFYYAVKRLADGKRPLLIIAGNHDNPERLAAPSTVLYENGAVVLSLPDTAAVTGDYGFYKITGTGAGYVEIEKGGERAVVLTMPFPSEKRLNTLVTEQSGEEAVQKSFSDKIKTRFDALSQKFRADTVNLVAGHFHITGGETSSSERDIQFGGSFAVNSAALPKNAQYIAMGHLHRAQKLPGIGHGFYAGSPIQYSVSEIAHAKSVYIIDVAPGGQATVAKENLRCYKPIELWEARSIQDALTMCEENKDKNCWVYLKINSDRPMLRSENKELLTSKKDIVKIILTLEGAADTALVEELAEKSILDEFIDFYQSENGVAPSDEIRRLFGEISREAAEVGL